MEIELKWDFTVDPLSYTEWVVLKELVDDQRQPHDRYCMALLLSGYYLGWTKNRSVGATPKGLAALEHFRNYYFKE